MSPKEERYLLAPHTESLRSPARSPAKSEVKSEVTSEVLVNKKQPAAAVQRVVKVGGRKNSRDSANSSNTNDPMRAAMRRASIDAGKEGATVVQKKIVKVGQNGDDKASEDPMRAAMRRASIDAGKGGPTMPAQENQVDEGIKADKTASRSTEVEDVAEMFDPPTKRKNDNSIVSGFSKQDDDNCVVQEFTGFTPESSPETLKPIKGGVVSDFKTIDKGANLRGSNPTSLTQDAKSLFSTTSPDLPINNADEIMEVESFGGSYHDSPVMKPQVHVVRQRQSDVTTVKASAKNISQNEIQSFDIDDFDLDIEEIS